jgi:glycosyltransferase involved in cell wall biosynthesis
MSLKPRVSILTVTFNHRKYIQDTIDSVLKQTYRNWEWIILDDGSTDGTGDIIKNIHDERIRYIFQEETSRDQYANNYNKALAISTGDYIAMLDGDDYWPDYKLESQVESFDDPGIVLSYGECCLVDEKGKKIGYLYIPDDPAIAWNNPIGSSLDILLKIVSLKRYFLIHTATVMLRKSALSSIGGFIYAKGAQPDFPTWTRLSLEGRFAPVRVCLGYWRRYLSCGSFRVDQVPLLNGNINFFREFVLQHGKRLHDLGFSYDMEKLEKLWEDVRREFTVYQPYNRAMLLLKLGAFTKAKDEFKKYIEKDPSLKNSFGYALVALSGLMHYDIVHPVIALKERLGKTLHLPLSLVLILPLWQILFP